jgi:hypothetical protein
MQQLGLCIDTIKVLRGRGLSRGIYELIEFEPRIGVRAETRHFHGHDRAIATTQAGRRAAKLPDARSML